jgi:predicted transcriptional regulator
MESHQPGRPNGLTRQLAEKQRLNIYSLALKGFSQGEIADSLGINQSSVSRSLSVMRKRNARWFVENRSPFDRYQGLFKATYDAIQETIRESWLLYHNTPNSNVEALSHLIARIQSGIALQARVAGVTAASLDELYFDEQFKDLQSRIKKLNEKNPQADGHPETGLS